MRRGLHQQGLSVPRAALGRRSVCWGAGLCIARVRSLSGTRREAGGEGFSSPGPRRALPAGLLRRELQVGPPVSQRAPMAEAPSSPLHALYCCSLSGQKYNVLHLRLERDWVEHCKEMAQPYKDSCLNNTYTGGRGGRAGRAGGGLPRYARAHEWQQGPGQKLPRLLLQQRAWEALGHTVHGERSRSRAARPR